MNPTTLSERACLASILGSLGAELTPNLARLVDFGRDGCTDSETAAIAEAIRKARANGGLSSLAAIGRHLERQYTPALMTLANSGEALPLELAEAEAERLLVSIQCRRTIAVLGEAWNTAKANPGEALSIAEHARTVLEEVACGKQTLGHRLEERLFNVHAKPPDPTPLFLIGTTPICTPGNLMTISGLPKTAKSAAVSAMLAAVIAGSDAERDCLGFVSANPNGFALIHLDTEQSPFDHWQLISNTLRRAGVGEPPPWLLSYSAVGFAFSDVHAAVPYAMAKAAASFGGIHSVHLDGVADLAQNVNDPEESNALVNELQGLAIKYHCTINGVIHLNPGTEKTRGHLGSQLERKAETNLRLERDGEYTVLWADKNRRAPISKAHGPRFVWSHEHCMFLSARSAAAAKLDVERSELASVVECIFGSRPAMTRSDLQTAFKTRLKVSDSSAYRKVNRVIELGFIKKSAAGLYVIACRQGTKAA